MSLTKSPCDCRHTSILIRNCQRYAGVTKNPITTSTRMLACLTMEGRMYICIPSQQNKTNVKWKVLSMPWTMICRSFMIHVHERLISQNTICHLFHRNFVSFFMFLVALTFLILVHPYWHLSSAIIRPQRHSHLEPAVWLKPSSIVSLMAFFLVSMLASEGSSDKSGISLGSCSPCTTALATVLACASPTLP